MTSRQMQEPRIKSTNLRDGVIVALFARLRVDIYREEERVRSVGMGIDPAGALSIAVDAGNTVWQIAAADGSVLPSPIGTDRIPKVSRASGIGADPVTTSATTEKANAPNRLNHPEKLRLGLCKLLPQPVLKDQIAAT